MYKFFYIYKLKLIYLLNSTKPYVFFHNKKFSLHFHFFSLTSFLIFFKISVSSIFKTSFIKSFYLSTLSYLYSPSIYFFNKFKNLKNFMILKKKINKPSTTWLVFLSSYSLIHIRANLQFLLNKNFLYQKKLTSFITLFYNFKIFEYLYWFEFTLIKILSKSFIFLSNYLISYLIINSFIRLNYQIISYKDYILSSFDFIYIKFNLFLLLLFFNSKYFFSFFKQLFFKILFNFNTKIHRIYPKMQSSYISNKLFKFSNFYSILPFFLEIDFLSMSVIILSCFYTYIYNVLHSFLIFFMLTNFKCFNWKYII